MYLSKRSRQLSSYTVGNQIGIEDNVNGYPSSLRP